MNEDGTEMLGTLYLPLRKTSMLPPHNLVESTYPLDSMSPPLKPPMPWNVPYGDKHTYRQGYSVPSRPCCVECVSLLPCELACYSPFALLWRAPELLLEAKQWGWVLGLTLTVQRQEDGLSRGMEDAGRRKPRSSPITAPSAVV